MLDTEFVHADAHEALAMSALRRAFWLDQTRFALRYEAIHGAPLGLSEDQLAQRKAILNIAEQILTKGRNREMREAVSQWAAYEAMTRE